MEPEMTVSCGQAIKRGEWKGSGRVVISREGLGKVREKLSQPGRGLFWEPVPGETQLLRVYFIKWHQSCKEVPLLKSVKKPLSMCKNM